MKNLNLHIRPLITIFLIGTFACSLILYSHKANAAFVPAEDKQALLPGAVSPDKLQNVYILLAGFSNREIEKLTGKKLTTREKIGLYLLRLQNKKKGSGQFQKSADWDNKCFTMALKNGDVIEVKLIQITTTEIKYQRCNKPDDPEIIIAKADVFSIKDSNGDAIYSSKDQSWKKGKPTGGTDKLALAAGLTGIGALTIGLLVWPVGLAAGIAAGVMGIMSMSHFKNNQNLRGEGWAITGIVAGSLWVLLGILVLIYFLAYY